MPWMDDEYLVDTRDRTLTPVTPELRYELSRIKSSTRRVIKAVSGEFERFVREGYRVVQRAGEGLFRNPEGWTVSMFSNTREATARMKRMAYRLSRLGFKVKQEIIEPSRENVALWSDAPRNYHLAAEMLAMHPDNETAGYSIVEGARAAYPEETERLLQADRGRTPNPHYNVLTKAQFDALKQLNRAYPKGDVYLGEIRLARGEQFSDALVAVEKIQRATGIAHDVVQFQGKYYSAPQAWVDKVLVDARMESRAARTPARPARSVSEQRGGGGIRGAVKAGWRELMSNPGFVRSDREELGNAFEIHHEALQSGKVDGSGSRAIEAMVRRLGLSQREADYILELAGPGADNKRVTEVWKGLESTDPQWSREETERIHDVRIEALGSPDWGRRGNPRGRGGRGGRSSKPMPYPWEMEVRAAYSPRFMSKDQYGELANLWHLSRVPASGTNWGRYERMLWTAKEFHKAHPEISEGAAYKDLDGLLSSGW